MVWVLRVDHLVRGAGESRSWQRIADVGGFLRRHVVVYEQGAAVVYKWLSRVCAELTPHVAIAQSASLSGLSAVVFFDPK